MAPSSLVDFMSENLLGVLNPNSVSLGSKAGKGEDSTELGLETTGLRLVFSD
jgi:hypothetical protein